MSSIIKKLKPKYAFDEQGKKVGVYLSEKEYEALIEELEDLHDYYIAIKNLEKKEPLYTLDQVKEVTLARMKK